MELQDLINLQSAILNRYNHNIWTTYGFYIGAIGWILTSDKSRSFLLSNPRVRVWVVVAAGLTVSLEIGVLFYLWPQIRMPLCLHSNLLFVGTAWR